MERFRRMRLDAGMLLCGAALLMFGGAVPHALGQACQTPLFVQEGSVEANVMILFDNSGSMNHAIHHPDYDPNTVYAGGYNSSSNYYVSKDGYVVKNGGRKAYLVKSYNQSGRYEGNYLNWIFWHATEEQRDTLPRVTRIMVAHEVVSDIIANSEGVRSAMELWGRWVL